LVQVSVLIPVYKESNLLETLLNDLIQDTYPSKEVFVIIDKPTEKSRDLVDKFRNQVYLKFILNKERIGKANVLNDAFKLTSGDVLLFLDSDIQIEKNEKSFLETIVEDIENKDILDLKKKTIRNSFLSKLVHYEYFFSCFVSWLFSKKIGKCLGIDGAAFAIKRKAFMKLDGFRRTISEDFDLATRAFLKDLSFKYTNNAAVSIKSPSDWHDWYKQRKRWSLATSLWLKDYHKHLGRIVLKHPQVLLPSLLIMLPSIVMLFSNFLISDLLYYQATSLSEYILAGYQGLTIPFFILDTFSIPIAKNLLVLILTYIAFSSLYYLSAKKLGFIFNPTEFLFFYFIYSPIFFFMITIGILRVIIKRDNISLDWKV